MKEKYLDVYECIGRRPVRHVCKIESSPENIATFIASAPYTKDYALFDISNECLLTTMGQFADLIYDGQLREEILKYLIPMQLGDTEIPKVKYKDLGRMRLNDDKFR